MARVAKEIQSLVPTRSDVFDAVRRAVYPGRTMSFILREYEEGQRGEVFIDGFQHEHMMPDTPTEYWYDAAGTRNIDEYKRIVNGIGNIAPLDPGTNNTVKNNDWATKSAWYVKNVPNWLVSKIARENPDGWTPAKIDTRCRGIAEWAVDVRWNLPERLARLERAIL
jgi:hypothetical protein